MRHSTDRILTTHTGSLPRPELIRERVQSRSRGEQKTHEPSFEQDSAAAIREIVRHQIDVGLDSVNDGELSKTNFTDYARTRIGGFEMRPAEEGRRLDITSRDRTKFAEYFEIHRVLPWMRNPGQPRPVCTNELHYIGAADLTRDIANLKAACESATYSEAFLTAVAPGAVEHWMTNRYYANDEEFLFAIGAVMREEYLAIVDAGFQLQVDVPDILDAWNCWPNFTLAEYRNYASLRIDALNEALRGIPREKVRMHACWGSFHGPHHDDIPLKDMVDLILRVNAGSYSIEASNPCHEHEWRVFETATLPQDATLVPGIVGHCSDYIEHPDLVAQRIVRYAQLVGRENVLAGTDCGLGSKVGHSSICWAKFASLVEGARRASQVLWGRA